MLDEIFRRLYLRMADEEWTSLEELRGIMKRRGLGHEEAEGIISFLRSYFLEVDEVRQKVRLSPWAHSFFQVSMP